MKNTYLLIATVPIAAPPPYEQSLHEVTPETFTTPTVEILMS